MTNTKHLIAAAALLALGASASAANLVSNGSFETGDFSGWSFAGNTGNTGVEGNFGGVNPTDGNFQGVFGAVGSDTVMTQQLTVNSTGLYTVSFDLDDLFGGAQDFSASFGGSTLVSYSSQPFGSYTHLSYTVEGGNGLLEFTARQDPSFWLLDNVSVTATAVPETSTPAMLLAGLALVGVVARRRRAAR